MTALLTPTQRLNRAKEDIQVTNWCFTLNNYSPDEKQYINDLVDINERVVYLCYGEEVGDNGTPHLQGYIEFRRTVKFGGVRAILPRCHIEARRGTQEQAIIYCQKDGKFFEFGTKKNVTGKKDYVNALNFAKEDKIDDIDPQMQIQYYTTLKKIASDNRVIPISLNWEEPPNEWHWGPTGTGKSKYCRQTYPDAYIKMCNKWWDGYKGEPNVLMEDIGTTHEYLGDHIKIWADRYGFRAEVKYDTGPLRPQKLIITSNYHINQLWNDPNIVEPLMRRFKIIEYVKPVAKVKYQQIIDHALGAKRTDGKFCKTHQRKWCGCVSLMDDVLQMDPNYLPVYNTNEELDLSNEDVNSII